MGSIGLIAASGAIYFICEIHPIGSTDAQRTDALHASRCFNDAQYLPGPAPPRHRSRHARQAAGATR
jgi:hypothetical protein